MWSTRSVHRGGGSLQRLVRRVRVHASKTIAIRGTNEPNSVEEKKNAHNEKVSETKADSRSRGNSQARDGPATDKPGNKDSSDISRAAKPMTQRNPHGEQNSRRNDAEN
jgi:hypothetical protein